MKHMFFLLMLIVSLFVTYLVFSGHMGAQRGAMPAVRAAFVPVGPGPAAPPRTDPVGTVHRVIRSGNNLGQNTRKAFDSVDFGREP